MNRQDDFAGLVVNIGDDVGDQRAHESLAGAHAHAGRVPGGFQVIGEAGQVRANGLRVWRVHRFQPRLARLHALQRGLPALLQFGGDQAVVGVAGGITSLGERCFIARLLQIELGHVLSVAQAFLTHALGLQRRLERHGLHDTEDLRGNSLIHARTAKSQATVKAEMKVRPVATATWAAGCPPDIGDRQATAAPTAREETAEQCSPAAPRLPAPGLAVAVCGELCLVALELRPVDVALVMVLQQNLPLLHRLGVTVCLPHVPIDDLGPTLVLSIRVDTSVEGTLQHRDHVAVADRRPVERNHCAAIRRAGEAELFRSQRQEHLSCAAQIAKPREDLADRLLDAHVGVETQSGVTIPDVANRDTDSEFAARCFGGAGIVHPGAQHAEFEF